MIVDDNVQPGQESPVVPMNATRDDSIQGPDGRVIEIIKGAIADDATTLRLALAETERLRKPKQIGEAACNPGIGWRVGSTADCAGALYAEVRDGPVALSMQEMDPEDTHWAVFLSSHRQAETFVQNDKRERSQETPDVAGERIAASAVQLAFRFVQNLNMRSRCESTSSLLPALPEAPVP